MEVMYFMTILIISGVLLFLHVTKNPLTLEGKLNSLIQKINQIMATQKELTEKITELTNTVTKVGGETRTLLTRIKELLEQLNNAEATPELQAAVTALEEQVAIVDGLVPDQE